MAWPSKARAFWPLLLSVFLVDCTTKQLATEHLTAARPYEVWGDWLRLLLAYNRGMAMGHFRMEAWARPLLVVIAVAMLGLLWIWYRRSSRQDWPTAAALGLIAGGALGNLLDRVRWDRGVVDFIEVGIGGLRFPWTFNVADVGITCGALWLIWRHRHKPEPSEQAA